MSPIRSILCRADETALLITEPPRCFAV